MLYIAHRINTISELKTIPIDVGVEIDLRDKDGTLILQHDPFKDGELFIDWCKEYKHAFLICNIKSEGIELRVKEVLEQFSIQHYFFLDVSIPMIMKLLKLGENNIAIRFSEVEKDAESFLGKCKWLWVDCFSHYPMISKHIRDGYKMCRVGPTLQGHNWEIQEEWKEVDAVCDKIYNEEKWKVK
jgi:hypothetical protein